MCLRRRCIERFWYKRARSIKIVISRMIFFFWYLTPTPVWADYFGRDIIHFRCSKSSTPKFFQKHVYKYYDCKNKLTRIQEILWEIEENISNDSTHVHTRACVNFPFKNKIFFYCFSFEISCSWLINAFLKR